MLGMQIVTGIVLAMHYVPVATAPSTASKTSCAT
jgi:quinol-cytochrome oxidoreductase complex cytochrome b subunit